MTILDGINLKKNLVSIIFNIISKVCFLMTQYFFLFLSFYIFVSKIENNTESLTN